ncbi:uncharacterized protein BYT42DRAFT_383746 [Radiomyces spectabilis]|uniref:uncharacterized protein n=1 Tax=Radiomyces spectabilis TaxID=64574 RepID=UPI00221F6218|nr:uncharacterized protein BYT42DRAFT_383746 [Radiomyces spectabilis]KAI8376345.1 hypothetical protein BYT42DRAFT_383746 [Radiomyces spectabilis]
MTCRRAQCIRGREDGSGSVRHSVEITMCTLSNRGYGLAITILWLWSTHLLRPRYHCGRFLFS